MLKVVDGGGEPASPEESPRSDPLADLARRATSGEAAAMRQLLRALATPFLERSEPSPGATRPT